MAVSIAVALMQSLLDYANSVCYGISARNLAKPQCIHIVAYHQPKRPTSSHVFNLHWLPIEHRINFKIATPTYKALATRQPGYLLNSLNTYRPVCSLRSQDNHLLAKPSVHTSIGCCCDRPAAHLLSSAVQVEEVSARGRGVGWL